MLMDPDNHTVSTKVDLQFLSHTPASSLQKLCLHSHQALMYSLVSEVLYLQAEQGYYVASYAANIRFLCERATFHNIELLLHTEISLKTI